MTKYILDGKIPVPCNDLMEWGRRFGSTNRHVAESYVGSLRVSTVFLGIDHRVFQGGGLPILFETMIFCIDNDYQVHCSTWDEAEKNHQVAVARAHQYLADS